MTTFSDIIGRHPFFEGLEKRYLDLVAGCAKNVVFDEGSYIFRQGDAADDFYIIREGRIALEIFGAERGAITIQTLRSGEILGWSWLIPPYRYTFDARVVEKSRFMALDGACLRKKCEADHSLGYELLKRFAEVMARRLEASRMQLLDIHAHPGGGKGS